jgi:hypothetical protein
MKTKATFYHAGCPVCVEAEHSIVRALDPQQYEVEIVHLGEDKTKIVEAKAKGIQSVPALSLQGNIFHINFGAAIDALK